MYGIEIVIQQKTSTKIAYNSIHFINRLRYLCRNTSGVLQDTLKPKFTELETIKPC